jgi:hypothetical protein
MSQFGGKDSKRHFTVVMGDKEHGLYVSSTPSSAAKKAVTKLCAANKKKKVEFYIREITQGSKKKTYGPYSGHIEKLKEPIELKGRIIKHKSVVKLQKKEGGGIFNRKLSESNRTPNAINKILENFKVVDENKLFNLKTRHTKTDSFYFGKNNLHKINQEIYYPYSIYNIGSDSDYTVNIKPSKYFNTVETLKKVNSRVIKFRILIFDQQEFINLLNEIKLINENTDLKKTITEQYYFNYEKDRKFIFFEFNLQFYLEFLKWMPSYYKLFLNNKKLFDHSKKLINNIYNNLNDIFKDGIKILGGYSYKDSLFLTYEDINKVTKKWDEEMKYLDHYRNHKNEINYQEFLKTLPPVSRVENTISKSNKIPKYETCPPGSYLTYIDYLGREGCKKNVHEPNSIKRDIGRHLNKVEKSALNAVSSGVDFFQSTGKEISKASNTVKGTLEEGLGIAKGTLTSGVDSLRGTLTSGVDSLRGMFNFKFPQMIKDGKI